MRAPPFSLSLRARLFALLLVPLLGMVVFASLWAATRLQAARDADASLERTEVIANLTDLLLDVQVQGRLLAVQSEPELLGSVAPVLQRREQALAAEVAGLLEEAQASRVTIARLAGTSPEQVRLLLANLPALGDRVRQATQLERTVDRRAELAATFAAYRAAAVRMERLLQSIASRRSGEIEAPALIALTALHNSVVAESELLLIAYLDRMVDAPLATRLREFETEQAVLLRSVSVLGLDQATAGVQRLRNSAAARTWSELRSAAVLAGLEARQGESAPLDESGLIRGASAANSRATALSDLRTDVATSVLTRSRNTASGARSDLIVAAVVAVALIVATLLLGLATIRPVSARLGALTSRAREIGQGNLSVDPISPRGNDEIDVLARSFEEMSATLSAVSRQTDSLAEGRTDDPALAEELPGHIGQSLQGSVARLRAVTARLRAGEALARSVVENAAEAIWLLDGEGRVRWANEAAANLLGRSSGEQAGMRPEQIVAHVEQWEGRTLPELSSFETEALHSDGRRIPVLLSSRRVAGERGEILTTVLARDISERKQFEVELQRAASYDGLTGLPNRTSFEARVARANAEARAGGTRFGLLFLDLDRFKQVNDALGHRVGDGLLTSVAERLRGAIREEDVVARIGGDEFVVLVEDVSDSSALTGQAERLLRAFDVPFEVEGEQVHVTASIGLALGDAAADDPAELLRDADIAMYRAKDAGRGRLERFDSAIRGWAEERGGLEQALRRALRSDGIEVAYQPIVGAADSRPWGAELLARWTLDGSAIPPSVFIPIAEATGLVTDISRLLLGQACDQLGKWRRDPVLSALHLTVNVSGHQLTRGDLAADVAGALGSAGAPPSRLSLELTESDLLADPKRARKPLERLRATGVEIAIDDFGTGHASLGNLRDLPVSAVKIDASLLARVASEPIDLAIVEMLASVSHAAGLEVVAEGIETEAQRAAAAACGCDLAQGFHFARPMPLEIFVEWARVHAPPVPIRR